jgi:hypothetical protein
VDAAEVVEIFGRITGLEAALEIARDEGADVVVGSVRERLERHRQLDRSTRYAALRQRGS